MFLSTTTHSHICRTNPFPETSLIAVDNVAARELTTPPPPLQPTPTASRRCRRMNNKIAAPAGHFPLFDKEQQEENGTYSGETHTLVSVRTRRFPPSPLPLPPHQQPTSTRQLCYDKTDTTTPVGYFPLLRSSNNRIASNPGNDTRSSRRVPRAPYPSPPTLASRKPDSPPTPLSLHSPSDMRAYSAELSMSHQQNQRFPHNRSKSHRVTTHA